MLILCARRFNNDSVALQLPGREEDRVNFERGIDPDVDDPTKCHRHSECLDQWPSHTEYEAYDQQVEQGMKTKVSQTGITADVLMAVEHNDMHHETLMYMGNECPYLGYAPHPLAAFESPTLLKAEPSSKGIVRIPQKTVRLGADEHFQQEVGFTWDNER